MTALSLYKTPAKLQIQFAEEWVKVLGLESLKEISFKNLSKAKQRLILIARAMIKHLPLLILDEAMINLDNQETAVVVSLIHKIV